MSATDFNSVVSALGGGSPTTPAKYTYQYTGKAAGPGSNLSGVNYYANGQPTTRELYAAGTGADVGKIESGAPQVGTQLGDSTAPSNPNGTAGSSGPTYQDKSNDIALQNAGLGAVDQKTASGIQAINDALGKLTGQYDTEAATNEGLYGNQSDANRNSLERNKESSLLNAAQGRRGLFGELSALGALNGSGIDLANEAVQKGANEDLTTAGDTFAGNQNQLDTAINAFRQSDKERRQNATTEATNARTNANNQGAKEKQQFYSNLANDYAAEGDSGNAKKYTDLASSLFPGIASTSVPDSNLAYTGAAFTPGSLANYLMPGTNTQVSTAPAASGNPGPSGLPGLFAATDRRKLVTA